ncbi:MAG TPA: phosphoribosylanthranilate isomerase [Pirellulales bacterium]
MESRSATPDRERTIVEPTQRVRVKICCISSRAEAKLAVEHGASALGLVSAMPSGAGIIDEPLIAEIAPTIPPGVASFLLTSQPTAEAIIDQQRRLRVNTLQLVDALPLGTLERLRETLPGVSLVQVIHVCDEDAIDEAIAASQVADAILLDSGNPRLTVKELGGTGRLHDWSISRRIRESIDKPIYLAGGLNAENVGEAIAAVRPWGVDVCSGVRTNGRLDAVKLQRFFEAVNSASV